MLSPPDRSSISLISCPEYPFAARSLASRADCRWVTDILWLSTTHTRLSYSWARTMAVWQDPLRPLDMGMWTTWSYSPRSLSHSAVTLSGVGCEVVISAPASILR